MGLNNFLNDSITEEDSYIYTLPQVLEYRAENDPGAIAFVFLKDGENDEEVITNLELYTAATNLARQLAELNEKGERAVLLFPPGLAFISSLFACFFAGIIAVPAYPPRKNRSMERIIKLVVDSGATIVLTSDEIMKMFERTFSDIKELQGLKWITPQQTEYPPDPPIPQSPNLQIPKSPNPQIPKSPNPQIPKSPHSRDIALLQYTSGSTGNPKGVIITFRNIMRNCEFIRNSFGFSRQTIAVSWLPVFHDMGLVGQIFQPVYTGFPGIFMSPVSFFQKPIRWLKAISKYRGTMGGAPNFAYDLLVDSTTPEERDGLDLSSLKTIYCGAEPIRKSTVEKFLAAYKDYGLKPEMFYPCYGMAETTLIASGPHALTGPRYLALSKEAMANNKVVPVPENDKNARFIVGVGHPWLDTRIEIMNPDTLELSKPDEIGEIWITGSSISRGYWNRTMDSKEKLYASLPGDFASNYLRSGDLGFFHEGELYISGRLKDLIIFHGRNIYPQDIEYLTENAHPAIRQNASAAFSIEIEEEEKIVIVAEVERSAIIGLNVDEVCDMIRENVAEETELMVYAIQLLRTASIPKTSSGKIQRKACRDAFIQNKLDVVGESRLEEQFHEGGSGPAPVDLSSLEAWLMIWIHEKLKIPLNRIDPSRSITAYGLTSMKAVMLQKEFLEKFDVAFPPYLFFEKTSLRQLCERALKLIEEKESIAS